MGTESPAMLPAASRILLDNDAFSDDDEVAINAVSGIAASLSILGSGFIIFAILYFKKWTQIHFKLVFMLSVADVINSFSFLIGNADDPSGACTFQGIVQQFGGTWSYCWIVAISFTLYRTMCFPDSDDDCLNENGEIDEAKQAAKERITFRNYNLILFGYTAVMTVLPFFGDTYGDSGAWCWIDNSDTGKVWRFLSFYVPVWIAMVAMGYMYYCIVAKIRPHLEGADSVRSSRIVKAMYRLIAYPVIMFVGYIFGTINRIQNAASPDDPSVALYCIASFTLNINGFFNALVYGFNDSMQKDLRACCCGGSADDDEPSGPPPVADADVHADGQISEDAAASAEMNSELQDNKV